eukprot:7377945-Prymnesium_polylepis.1
MTQSPRPSPAPLSRRAPAQGLAAPRPHAAVQGTQTRLHSSSSPAHSSSPQRRTALPAARARCTPARMPTPTAHVAPQARRSGSCCPAGSWYPSQRRWRRPALDPTLAQWPPPRRSPATAPAWLAGTVQFSIVVDTYTAATSAVPNRQRSASVGRKPVPPTDTSVRPITGPLDGVSVCTTARSV